MSTTPIADSGPPLPGYSRTVVSTLYPTFVNSDSREVALYNRGPVTEAISLPASCTGHLTLGSYISTNESAYRVTTWFSWYHGHWWSNSFDPSCYPTGTKGGFDAPEAWETYYYSPAVCPSGWVTAFTFTSSTGWISIRSPTTAALCCPQGWGFYTSNSHSCESLITRGAVYTVVARTIDGAALATPSTYKITATSDLYVWGDGIPIWWQSSDLSVFAAAATRSRTRSTNSLSGLPGPTKTVISDRLSTGGIIGIGLGVPFAIVLGIVIGFIVYRSRQKLKARLVREKGHARHSTVTTMTDVSHLPEVMSQGNYR